MKESDRVIELKPEDSKLMKKFDGDQRAAREFVALVQQQGEQRLSELSVRGKEMWSKIGKDYNLDLEHVAYSLSNDGTKLIATGERFDVI